MSDGEVRFVLYGNGRVKHIVNPDARPVSRDGRPSTNDRSATLCKMFYSRDKFQEAVEWAEKYPICGACRRSTKARGMDLPAEED